MQLGEVRHHAMPPASKGMRCTKAVNKAAHALDFCAIELDAKAPASPTYVDYIASDLTIACGDDVEFKRENKKIVNARVAGLSVWLEIDVRGEPHCYADMLIIEEPRGWYVKPGLTRPGDSGTWILFYDTLTVAWYGVIVGGDGVHGYCSFAQAIYRNLDNHSALDLDFMGPP